VAVKDFFVEIPIKHYIDVVLAELVPDTPDVRAGIEQSVRDMLFVKAKPGQTIYAAWKSEAVLAAPFVDHFKLVVNDDDVMPSTGHMALLGDISYD
jgi:hypothetical protein